MKFWQFKFNMKKGEWDEFETIASGEKFTQSTTKNLLADAIGDIVFYYRTDKDRGVWFIAEIISSPYRDDYNLKYAIDLRVIKKLDKYFDYEKDFAELHSYYNTTDVRKRVQTQELIKDEFKPQKLYKLLMDKTQKLDVKDIDISDDDTKIASKIKEAYIENGYLFNAFHNLNLIRGEVKHLAFIGNLLNPYGNHFKNDLFLKYFIQSLREYKDLQSNEILENFINNNPAITVEKSIYNADGKNIGRVDLWLESDEYIIAIEGKIEAKDNEGQLKKYDKYLKGQDKKYLLIYLTLKKSEEPEKVDMKELSNFHLMNFEQDILDFIDYSLEDEHITGNIESTLFDYRDALVKYIYQYHLSFQYSYELIQEMTKDKQTFEKYQKIKEYYYQNMTICKNSVIEDIAENFEYAKAHVERLFFIEIKKYVEDKNENYSLNIDDSSLSLHEDDISIAKDIANIARARKNRINSHGRVSVCFNEADVDALFVIEIINDYYGVLLNSITAFSLSDESIDNPIIEHCGKLSPDIFKSNNIAKLLDKKYMQKQIETVFSK
jgi:hypothetical protein